MPGIFDIPKVFTQISVVFDVNRTKEIDERGNPSGEPYQIVVRFKIGRPRASIDQENQGSNTTSLYTAYCLEERGLPKVLNLGHTGTAEINGRCHDIRIDGISPTGVDPILNPKGKKPILGERVMLTATLRSQFGSSA
ncbi:MAG: hypothetical protein F6K55_03365 [Moorea sp. SIO4A3]|nr:hypothetical protein [Moorena sp. SIO4A3]